MRSARRSSRRRSSERSEEIDNPPGPPATPRVAPVVGVLGVGVAADPLVVAADDLALTRGDGCFEATRVETDDAGRTEIDHLDAHLERLARSAAALDIPVDVDAWRSLVGDVTATWVGEGEAILRLFVSAGPEGERGTQPRGIAMLAPMPATMIAERAGIDVVTLSTGRAFDAFRDAPWLLGGVKTLSYATNMAAGRAAADAGAHDALMVSTDGWALEGPRSALIWRRGDVLATTEVDGTGVLHSITQCAVFAGAEADGTATSYGRIRVVELTGVDGVGVDGAWLVSSGRLVAPILRLDGHRLAVDVGWTDRLGRWVHARVG